MTVEEEAAELHAELKPRGVDNYRTFMLSQTRADLHDAMETLVNNDLAGPGIAYAYIDVQTITAAATVTMLDGERWGNTALFVPRAGGNGVGFASQVLIEMQAWFPVVDNASGAGELTFMLNKGGQILQRSNVLMVGKYVTALYLGIMQAGDDVSLQAVCPAGSVDIQAGGYATLIATPCV